MRSVVVGTRLTIRKDCQGIPYSREYCAKLADLPYVEKFLRNSRCEIILRNILHSSVFFSNVLYVLETLSRRFCKIFKKF